MADTARSLSQAHHVSEGRQAVPPTLVHHYTLFNVSYNIKMKK